MRPLISVLSILGLIILYLVETDVINIKNRLYVYGLGILFIIYASISYKKK
ncbi:hypothetical protein GCM10009433_04250 [Psychroflexus lacisalsi]|uniref:Exosortase n=1 Tax=Psychroflexus lacisalsi TaxID=503928 RepID=A0ABP3V9E5_9FLAO